MNIQSIRCTTPLRQRMIEDMATRNLDRHSRRSHLSGCERVAAFLERSPETATVDDICRFQLILIESGASICNRNRIMSCPRSRALALLGRRLPPSTTSYATPRVRETYTKAADTSARIESRLSHWPWSVGRRRVR